MPHRTRAPPLRANLHPMRGVRPLWPLCPLCLQVSGIHSHAAQRLISLTTQLSRRWIKLSTPQPPPQGSAQQQQQPPPAAQDVAVLGEFVRILLEVIHTVLSTSLSRNPELVYALLHRQDELACLAGRPGVAEVVDNLRVIADFFNARLDSAGAAGAGVSGGATTGSSPEWSVERVLALISSASTAWRGDGLRPLPELRFVYEEEESPEEFFVPYAWALGIQCPGPLPWGGTPAALLAQLGGVAVGEAAGGGLQGTVSNASSAWSEDLAAGS